MDPAQSSAELRLEVPRKYEAVRDAARRVREFLDAQGLAEKDMWACELAVVEACNNAVLHGQTASAEEIVVEAACTAREVTFRIRDAGPGFDWPAEINLPESSAERGRGLFLMKTLMDGIEYVRQRPENCLTLHKQRAQP